MMKQPVPHKRAHRLAHSRSYRLSRHLRTLLDDYYLDGVINLFPIAGSLLGLAFGAVFWYAALFKLGSVRLTLVLLGNSLKDAAIGLIPILGMVFDFFYKSHRRNFELLDGFAAGNDEIVRQVNRQAAWMVVIILVLCVCIYGLIVLSMMGINWLMA